MTRKALKQTGAHQKQLDILAPTYAVYELRWAPDLQFHHSVFRASSRLAISSLVAWFSISSPCSFGNMFPVSSKKTLPCAGEEFCGTVEGMPQRNCIYSPENAPKYYVLKDGARSRPETSGGGTDVFWAGLQILSLPPDKMATRVASSLCLATGLGDDMIISSMKEYQEKAVSLALNCPKSKISPIDLRSICDNFTATIIRPIATTVEHTIPVFSDQSSAAGDQYILTGATLFMAKLELKL
ncbi:hypothetical protein FXO38_23318 [Capsicum annuum]|nr:hypothetical protein FXO38_23318 [Capsicum annuum]KAF3639796.1 hypothetical protein FXO37_23808 [Capsicum annuum]